MNKKTILIRTSVYICAFFSVLFLAITFIYVIHHGWARLNGSLFTGNYHAQYYTGIPFEETSCASCGNYEGEGFYVERYGIALIDDYDLAGNVIIRVDYVDEASPIKTMKSTQNDTVIALHKDQLIGRIAYHDYPSSLTRQGASSMAQTLEQGHSIREITYSTMGGGIRGSLLATLYLIGLSLIMALPIGIMSAIYLNEFAPTNKMTSWLRRFIEMLTGVPSIIYGLLGISVFVPLTIRLDLAKGSSLIAGGMTMAVILLPTVIRTTEETLKSIPQSYRDASLALGASHTQTIFKVILPNTLPGMLTATFLSIGRIIGESAALIFVLGTAIRDSVRIDQSATTLSVHIWSIMTDEPANIELASTIALIILLLVLVLNIGIKLMTRKLNKKW